ncbi:Prefoldin subunit-domain-containing protein [Leucosporidium creatinivorum]|uniref:Prefoldin subunit 3 n=1 Tax=Leucosporidium creatinivorum TaxID=106004 RepID=A0A1Y2FS47_9BASI|nr:Prefoldin subunit-domain-containing protein [Leucosporidium creatinivorum]
MASTSTSTATAEPSRPSSPLANPRGIPKAIFLENVESFIGGPDGDAEESLQSLQQVLAKYRYMESNSLQRRQGLEEKVPELERTIAMVETLQRKKTANESFDTTFELSDTLYATGEVEEVDEVYVWLGANTMLSYPLSSAYTLLSTKLAAAQTSLSNVKQDLSWLRDQITVTEVNVARVYNWDVKRRRERREQE